MHQPGAPGRLRARQPGEVVDRQERCDVLDEGRQWIVAATGSPDGAAEWPNSPAKIVKNITDMSTEKNSAVGSRTMARCPLGHLDTQDPHVQRP